MQVKSIFKQKKTAAPVDAVDSLGNGIKIRIHPVSNLFWSVSVEATRPLECYHAVTSIEEAELLATRLTEKYQQVNFAEI